MPRHLWLRAAWCCGTRPPAGPPAHAAARGRRRTLASEFPALSPEPDPGNVRRAEFIIIPPQQRARDRTRQDFWGFVFVPFPPDPGPSRARGHPLRGQGRDSFGFFTDEPPSPGSGLQRGGHSQGLHPPLRTCSKSLLAGAVSKAFWNPAKPQGHTTLSRLRSASPHRPPPHTRQ